MQDQTFDILSINETRLDNTIHSDEVKITGYDLIRKGRNRNGGGVAIYVRRTVDHGLVYVCRKVSISKEKPKIVETRQFKNFNTSNFQQDLRWVLGSVHMFNCTEPNTAWHVWKMAFLEVADRHAPLKTRKVKSEYNLPHTLFSYSLIRLD